MRCAQPNTWKVNLHGGHSGAYCDHARGALRDILEAAVAQGYHTYGVTEHAPRAGARYLYPEETAMGWTVETLERHFDAYARELEALAAEFAPRLTVLRGFEAEVVPPNRYAELMLGLRKRYAFDYMVGSVHYVDDILIDGPKPFFEQAVEKTGGLERLAVRYYQTVAEMVETLKPEVAAHLDLPRKNAPAGAPLDTPAIREAAFHALEAVRAHGCILDLNSSALRKGLEGPYPAPWLLRRAHEMGIGFCFGDDSHGPEQVGSGLEESRRYLLENGVGAVTVLTLQDSALVKKEVPLH